LRHRNGRGHQTTGIAIAWSAVLNEELTIQTSGSANITLSAMSTACFGRLARNVCGAAIGGYLASFS